MREVRAGGGGRVLGSVCQDDSHLQEIKFTEKYSREENRSIKEALILLYLYDANFMPNDPLI